MSQGVMYVEILPSTKGIGKAVEKDTTAAFKGAGKESDGFFAKVGRGLKKVGVGIVAAGALVTGIAVKGGISRALNIEDAQAKLKGLGHDTKSVEQIMTDALGAVKGTAFGLDAAATTAASAVAAGIKPGKELEKYLRLTADAATIAGVSMDEMGDLMNKVAAKGKVSAREINQFTERGIPILQMLAEEYGVTTEAMSEMVTKGEVDAERFRKALEKNVGGAALESGKTTRGAFQNMMASLSRLGEVLVGDGLGWARTFFNEMITVFDGIADRLKPWVKDIQSRLSEAFTIEGLGDKVLDAIDRFVDAIANGPIPSLLNALAPVLPALWDLVSVVGGALGDAFVELGEALAPVLPLLTESLVDAIVELLPPLTDLLIALLPIVPPLVDLAAAIIPLAADLVDLLVPAVEWVVELLAQLAESVALVFDWFANDTDPQTFVDSILSIEGPLSGLMQLASDAGQSIADFVNGALGFFDDLEKGITTTLEGISNFFETTWETIGLVLGGALKVIVGLITGDMDLVEEGIAQSLDAIKDWWDETWGKIGDKLAEAWNEIVTTVETKIAEVVTWFRDLPGRIVTELVALPGRMEKFGREMVQGLINGLESMITEAVISAQNLARSVADSVKNWLGIKSPSTVFAAIGKNVGEGLVNGITGTVSQTKAAVKKLADSVVKGYASMQSKIDASRKKVNQLQVKINSAKTAADRARFQAEFNAEAKHFNALKRMRTSEYWGLQAFIKKQGSALDRLAGQRAKISERLEDLRKKLADLQSEYVNWSSSVVERIGSLGSIVGYDSVPGMIDNLRDRIKATQEFNDIVQQLIKHGLNDSAIESLTQEFASKGTFEAAKALAEGGKEAVSEVNTLNKQLELASSNLSKNVGGHLFQAGIDAAKGLVQGLQSQEKALEAQAKKVADTITRQVKKVLKIKSPSRVFRDEVGKMIGLGLLEGVGDEGIRARIDRSVSHLVSVPDAVSVSAGRGDEHAVFHLYDSDGQLWGSLKGIVDRATRPVSSGSLMMSLGV